MWQIAKAYFVSLTLRQEPCENYVAYSFEFWEDFSEETAFQKVSEIAAADSENDVISGTYTVVKGDTLWAIANKYGTGVAQLIAKNPQIKNPNLIYPGDIIKL